MAAKTRALGRANSDRVDMNMGMLTFISFAAMWCQRREKFGCWCLLVLSWMTKDGF
jgi:hypothetical protein